MRYYRGNWVNDGEYRRYNRHGRMNKSERATMHCYVQKRKMQGRALHSSLQTRNKPPPPPPLLQGGAYVNQILSKRKRGIHICSQTTYTGPAQVPDRVPRAVFAHKFGHGQLETQLLPGSLKRPKQLPPQVQALATPGSAGEHEVVTNAFFRTP